jgi:CheY-like chemotaxis protein
VGLTLVKLLVELHGGSIEVRSEGLGKGAEFIVRLPAIEQQPVTAPAAGAGAVEVAAPAAGAGRPTEGLSSTPDPGSLRVLVVDDNIDAADSTAMLLSLDGFEAHSVHSAKEALDAFASLKPDVVLLDIGLPEMDGYDVARRLREMAPDESPTIVALTGYGQPADRDRAASAGFDEFLVKPVEPRVLNELLRSFH